MTEIILIIVLVFLFAYIELNRRNTIQENKEWRDAFIAKSLEELRRPYQTEVEGVEDKFQNDLMDLDTLSDEAWGRALGREGSPSDL